MTELFVNLICDDQSWGNLTGCIKDWNRYYQPDALVPRLVDQLGLPIMLEGNGFRAHVYPPARKPVNESLPPLTEAQLIGYAEHKGHPAVGWLAQEVMKLRGLNRDLLERFKVLQAEKEQMVQGKLVARAEWPLPIEMALEAAIQRIEALEKEVGIDEKVPG